MSKAYQCDRCKRCFSIDEMDGEKYILKCSSCMKLTKENILNSTFTKFWAEQHFCPRCTREFEAFMESAELWEIFTERLQLSDPRTIDEELLRK